MNMLDRMVKVAEERKTILCFGIDPDLERMDGLGNDPRYKSVESMLGPYFHDIIDKLLDENQIAAIKPNYAYFAQYGFDGLYVLQDLIQKYRNKVPVILDFKRGDIGKTSEAYAREAYGFWNADCVTLSPYMGYDSIAPFLRPDKLAYVLCRTSNKSASDFQELKVRAGSKPSHVYERVADAAAKWGCGLVVGATSTAIKKLVKQTKGNVPFLIPGIGSQGGDLDMVMKAISGSRLDSKSKNRTYIHRINASSSIAYAFEKRGGKPETASLHEAKSLNRTMRKYL